MIGSRIIGIKLVVGLFPFPGFSHVLMKFVLLFQIH